VISDSVNRKIMRMNSLNLPLGERESSRGARRSGGVVYFTVVFKKLPIPLASDSGIQEIMAIK
jgi:hypothetical protein